MLKFLTTKLLSFRGRKGKWTEEDTGIVIEEKEGVSYEGVYILLFFLKKCN